MSEHRVCPCCGYDLALDAPVLINDFSMNGPGFPLTYHGKPIKMTFMEATICWSLMKACPTPLKTIALAGRLGVEESENPDSVMKVLVCRIRKRLREAELPVPIKTIHGARMYAWDPRS